MKKLLTSLRVFFTFAAILGLIYPLFIMLLGQKIFPVKANGSLISHNGKIIGSSLIAQKFSSPKYFHSRPSAIDYNAQASGGSNLAISSKTFIKQTKERIKKIKLKNNIQPRLKLPADMALNSASGLDPQISLANAILQLPRVTQHRNLSKSSIRRLIYSHRENDFIGIWGQGGINVLKLNLTLDRLEKKKR